MRLKNKVDEEKMGSPVFLMVLVSSGHAYKREDGVFVIPIVCLRN
jgi:hypothetical protein